MLLIWVEDFKSVTEDFQFMASLKIDIEIGVLLKTQTDQKIGASLCRNVGEF